MRGSGTCRSRREFSEADAQQLVRRVLTKIDGRVAAKE